MKLYKNMGDCGDFSAYGGLLVYREGNRFQAEYWQAGDSEEDNGTAYRFDLDKCTLTDGILSDNPYHPKLESWFAKSIESMASFGGVSTGELRQWFCSEDIYWLGRAYELLGHYHGFFELDSYPLELSEAEARKRYYHVERYNRRHNRQGG